MNKTKPYCCGLIIGRFQTLHKGHEKMILKALNLCDSVIICIGSSQESGTSKNPFDYEIRKRLIVSTFSEYSNRLTIIPLEDANLGDNQQWGDYVLQKVEERTTLSPDIIISAKEKCRKSWFEDVSIDELIIPKDIEISATQMRQWLINDDYYNWSKYCNKNIHDKYEFLRQILLLTDGKENT